MTRGDRLRRTLVAAVCLGSGIAFAALLPGSGAGADRGGHESCSSPSSHAPWPWPHSGQSTTEAPSQTEDSSDVEAAGKHDSPGCSPSDDRSSSPGGDHGTPTHHHGRPTHHHGTPTDQADPKHRPGSPTASPSGHEGTKTHGPQPTSPPVTSESGRLPGTSSPPPIGGGVGHPSGSPPGRESPTGTQTSEPSGPGQSTEPGTSTSAAGPPVVPPAGGGAATSAPRRTTAPTPGIASVPASDTTLTLGAENSTSTSTPAPPSQSDATSSSGPGQQVEVAAKSTVGSNDSVLLAVLLLCFTIAVSGVVLVAGRRSGRRAR